LPFAKIKNKLAKFIKIYAYQTKQRPTLCFKFSQVYRRNKLILAYRKPKNGFKAQKRLFMNKND